MTTCAWCDKDLGTNDLLAEYPIGRKLAFDPATARLWAICPRCDRWNLSFLDESEARAAIARLENFLAATPHRTDSDDMTFGEVGKTELIRVGATGWRSFAAWRYGRKLHERYRRWLVMAPLGWAIALYLNSPDGRALLEQMWLLLLVTAWGWLSIWEHNQRIRHRLHASNGTFVTLHSQHVWKSVIHVNGDRWSLFIPHGKAPIQLESHEAVRALVNLLPGFNSSGASRKAARKAVDLILSVGDPARFVATTFSRAGLGDGAHPLNKIHGALTVALEIAVNEVSERRALDNQLSSVRIGYGHAREIGAYLDGR